MNRNADLNLRVYAVVYSMRASDSPEAFSPAQERLADPRVTHYRDEPQVVGCGYLDGVPAGYTGPVPWTAFYVFTTKMPFGKRNRRHGSRRAGQFWRTEESGPGQSPRWRARKPRMRRIRALSRLSE